MKKIIIILTILILSLSIVIADESIDEGKKLVNSKVSCNNLNETQLEKIGDYIMEQMHPGEQHTSMENMMGGEESETLKQSHINMARRFYCGENSINMMGGGMMAGMMYGNGMMGYGSSGMWWLWAVLGILFMLGLVLLVWILIIKYWKEINKKK